MQPRPKTSQNHVEAAVAQEEERVVHLVSGGSIPAPAVHMLKSQNAEPQITPWEVQYLEPLNERA